MSEQDKEDDILVGRLLSGRDEPTVLEREALWERVSESFPKTRKQPLLAWVGLLGAVGAAAALLFALPRDDFAVRGGDKASVHAECVSEDRVVACNPGTTLAVTVVAPEGTAYIALFLELPNKVVLWAAPEPDAQTSVVDGILAIRLSKTHPQGRTTVVVVLTPRPVTRNEVKNALDGDIPDDWILIERAVQVSP